MNKKGFTLIELLAVIVILAIILAIAIPSITGIISSTTKNAMESDAKLVLKGLEYKLLEDDTYDITSIDEANIESELGVSANNYSSVEITKENNVATIIIVGKNKWEGLVAYGTIGDIKVVNAEDYNGDITKPVITMLGTSPVIIDAGSVYNDAGATALDDTDGNVTANIVTTSTVNVNVAGSYTVTYNVSDAAGNVAIPVVRIVNVVAVLATITTTDPVSNITTSGATISGNVTSDGGTTIIERGIVYGTSADPTVSGNKVVVAGTTGSFSGNITGLTNGVTYHARAYATNNVGTSYGSDITFITLMGGIDEYAKLMLHMDGADNGTTFTDEIGKTVSRYGDTVTKTGTKKFGTASGYFDGSGDYLSIPDSDDWYFGTGDFAVEAYIYLTSDDLYMYDIMAQYRYSGGYDDCAWTFDYYPTNEGLRFTWQGNYISTAQPYSITKNVWHHVAAVRNGNTMMLFYDGVKVKEVDCTGLNIGNSGRTLNIGYLYANGNYYWSGYIDEVRISKGIARWTNNFTPPAAPYSE